MASVSPVAADGQDQTQWTSLSDLLDADPASLSRSSADAAPPRLAKDEGFALEVQKIWKEENMKKNKLFKWKNIY